MMPFDLKSFDVCAVWENAVKILSQIGLLIENPKVRAKVAGILEIRDGYARFPAEMIEHYADELRRRSLAQPRHEDPARLIVYNSKLHYYYLDPQTGGMRLFDMKTLVECAKYAYRLADEGIYPGAIPGYPMDVPPKLQLLTSNYLEYVYSKNPAPMWLAMSVEDARFQMEMAAAMGKRYGFGTEMISPLKFMGSSIDFTMDLYEPGMPVSSDPMPIMGVTAPLDWTGGWALSVAENLGSYILFRLCGMEEVCVSLRLFLPNMATGMAYFSSPKHLMALLTRRKIHEFFGMTAENGEFLLVTSKAPDQQAAVEKMAGCLAGALYGFKYLEAAGGLFMDMIFSPQQLMIDIEICDFVLDMLADLPPAQQDIVSEIHHGIEAGSFLSGEHTLKHYAEYMWRPRLFDLAIPNSGRGLSFLAKASAPSVEEKVRLYTYELGGEKRERLERIMERARKELS
ncbi:MAG: trimethylamine methyltransferase family protein [Armatimonadetes bacterium]|nr:trimethylamine methyltransferase family protein [Armatimonadota bacterium]